MKPLIFYCLLLLVFISTPFFAQNTVPRSARYFPERGEITAFFDTLVTRQLEELNVPGVVISMTHKDSLLFSKGYGYADLDLQMEFVNELSPSSPFFQIAVNGDGYLTNPATVDVIYFSDQLLLSASQIQRI